MNFSNYYNIVSESDKNHYLPAFKPNMKKVLTEIKDETIPLAIIVIYNNYMGYEVGDIRTLTIEHYNPVTKNFTSSEISVKISLIVDSMPGIDQWRAVLIDTTHLNISTQPIQISNRTLY